MFAREICAISNWCVLAWPNAHKLDVFSSTSLIDHQINEINEEYTKFVKEERGKKTLSSAEISHKATCLSLELPPALICPICSKLSDQMVGITKKGRQNNKSFRQTNQRNRFQQRWSKKIINFLVCRKVECKYMFEPVITYQFRQKL